MYQILWNQVIQKEKLLLLITEIPEFHHTFIFEATVLSGFLNLVIVFIVQIIVLDTTGFRSLVTIIFVVVVPKKFPITLQLLLHNV